MLMWILLCILLSWEILVWVTFVNVLVNICLNALVHSPVNTLVDDLADTLANSMVNTLPNILANTLVDTHVSQLSARLWHSQRRSHSHRHVANLYSNSIGCSCSFCNRKVTESYWQKILKTRAGLSLSRGFATLDSLYKPLKICLNTSKQFWKATSDCLRGLQGSVHEATKP